MRVLAGGVCALAMLVGLAGSGGAQTLQIAVDQSPVGLDPHVATALRSRP